MIDKFEQQVIQTETPQPVNASELLSSEPPKPDQIIKDFIDVRDKLAIIGSSKLRKTFFLLQLLLCIAAGRDFLSWLIPKARRIFHIQYEIQSHHYHRRIRNMAKTLHILPDDLQDRFQILNARGLGLSGLEGIEKIVKIVKPFEPEIISFDPLYKVAAGAENYAKLKTPEQLYFTFTMTQRALVEIETSETAEPVLMSLAEIMTPALR